MLTPKEVGLYEPVHLCFLVSARDKREETSPRTDGEEEWKRRWMRCISRGAQWRQQLKIAWKLNCSSVLTTDTAPVKRLYCCVTHTFPQLFAVAATLKSIDYNVAMTFILNNNNNNRAASLQQQGLSSCLHNTVKNIRVHRTTNKPNHFRDFSSAKWSAPIAIVHHKQQL